MSSPKKQKLNNSKYPINSVFNINEAKVIYAEAGTSLFALANNYNVSFKKLLEFNDLEEVDILTVNQLIFLQKKSKKEPQTYMWLRKTKHCMILLKRKEYN
jgi:LysM repeat protein